MRVDALESLLGSNIPLQAISPANSKQSADDESTAIDYTKPNQAKMTTYLQIGPNAPAKAKALRKAQIQRMGLQGMLTLLKVSENKLAIMRLLQRYDWLTILQLLPKALLVNALRLFNKKKLLRLIMSLPKKFLIQLLLQIFKLEELIQKMPTSELLSMFRNKRINSAVLTKSILTLDPKFILMLLQKVYGNHDYSNLKPYDLVRVFMHTPKERLMEAFKSMPFKPLQQMLTVMVKQDPQLLMGLNESFAFKLLEKCPKASLVEACQILPPDLLIKMLSTLPNQLLMLAAAQIDDTTFGKYLMSQHASLIESLATAVA